MMLSHHEASVDELAVTITSSLCPFGALGLTPNSNRAEVKSAYRRLCLLFHPDKSTLPGQLALEVFHALQKAYTAAIQQLQPVHETFKNLYSDPWGQFYAPPYVATGTGDAAAPLSAGGAAPRPTHAGHQGKMWASIRCPMMSAWSRRSTAGGAAAQAGGGTVASGVDAGELGNEDAVGQVRAGERSTGLYEPGASAAQPSHARPGRRGTEAAKPPGPNVPRASRDAHKAPADTPVVTTGAAMPAGKRRRVATGHVAVSQQHPAKAPESGLTGALRQRHCVPGPRGPAGLVGDGSMAPSVKCPGLEDAGRACQQGLNDEKGGDMPHRALEPNVAEVQGAQPGNAWARRPLLGATVRQAAYSSLFAKADGDCNDDRAGVSAAAALTGSFDGAPTRARGPHHSSQEPPQEGCSTDSEIPGSRSSQDSSVDVPSPSSTDWHSSGSEENSRGAFTSAAHGLADAPVAGCASQAPRPPRKPHVLTATRPLPGRSRDAAGGAASAIGTEVEDAQSTIDLELPCGRSCQPGSSVMATMQGSAAFGRLWPQRSLHRDGKPCVVPPGAAKAAGRSPSLPGPPAASSSHAAATSSSGLAPNPTELQVTGRQAEGHHERNKRQDHALMATNVLPGSRLYPPRAQCTLSSPPLLRSQPAGIYGHTATGDVLRQQFVVQQAAPAEAYGGARSGDGPESCGGGQSQPIELEAGGGSVSDAPDFHDLGRAQGAPWGIRAPTELQQAEVNTGLAAVGQADDGECNRDAGEAEPDDDWWTEPFKHGDEGEVVLGVTPRVVQDGQGLAGPHTLEMFLKQVQQGGELQAQRAGQLRVGNLRRNALLGRRGRHGGRASRGSGKPNAGRMGRGTQGRNGTSSILRYSRPVNG